MKLLFFWLLLSLSGKHASDNGIPYRALSWTDFRGAVPAEETSIAAWTATELQFDVMEVDGQFTYSVQAHFLPYSSYVRVKSKKALDHEQTHFQIAYYAALLCMLYMEPYQGGDTVAKEAAVKLYDHYVEEKNALNEQFDRETNHGLSSYEEQQWEDRMSREIKITLHARRNKNP